MNRRKMLQLGIASSLGTLFSPHAEAQSNYPDRAVKLIVPRPAGGVVDVIAREWSDRVGKTFGPTYIENMGGGGGIIGFRRSCAG